MPLSIVTQVEFDTLDLDSFLAAGVCRSRSRPRAVASSAPSVPPVPGPSLGLKAKVAKSIWHQETIGGVDVDVALRGSTFG